MLWEEMMAMMINDRRHIQQKVIRILFFISIILFIPVRASTQTNDFGTWWGVEIKKTFRKKFRVSLEVEARLNENSTALRNIYVEPGFAYRPLKWLRFQFQYRFDNRYQYSEKYFLQRHRISFDVQLKKTIKRWSLEYRNRTQLSWDNYYEADREYPRIDNRNMVGASFKWPQLPLRTILETEFWLPLNYNEQTPDRLRVTLAQEVIIQKQHSLQIRFLYQHNLDVSEPEQNFILSTRYSFSL